MSAIERVMNAVNIANSKHSDIPGHSIENNKYADLLKIDRLSADQRYSNEYNRMSDQIHIRLMNELIV